MRDVTGSIPVPPTTILLGRYVKVQKRSNGKPEVWWVAPPAAIKKGYRPKTAFILADLNVATPDSIAAAKKAVAAVNEDLDATFGPSDHPAVIKKRAAIAAAQAAVAIAVPEPPVKRRSEIPMIEHEELLRRLHYDPATGVFTWIDPPGTHVKAGDRAGFVHPITGYVIIGINGRMYLGHRLAWFYHYGVWPERIIDHQNRDRAANWIDNLRDVSHVVNQANSGPSQYPPDPYRRSQRRVA